MKTSDQIRSGFLRYFEERGHHVVASSPLVPQNDPSLLFANAGMNQFKDLFLGREKRDYTRAASSQKCVRAGGKHNDLENVGLTARHHTFFEMLGNFSFGDYFKKEAIAFAWELLTRELGLPPERLKVTIFKGEEGVPRDAEAHGFWLEHVPGQRILELGAKDNFWAMGDTGPCGPCSEIHYFQGDDLPCAEESAGRTCLGVECECDRWLEVWNLVFMQFDRDAAGRLSPLPAPCVDTGMGLERIAAVVQGKRSNYDADLFTPLLAAISKRAGRTYGAGGETDVSQRVIADHLRATTFLIADGVLPGNEGRGYVLRKIMRRAMRHGRKLGIDEPFLAELTRAVVARMAPAYPELLTHAESVARVVRVEEERFGSTLKVALAAFDRMADRIRIAQQNITASQQAIPPHYPDPGKQTFDPSAQQHLAKMSVFPGKDAFDLYDTYGLHLDLLEELALEKGFTRIDKDGFERELQAQRERARQASKLGALSGAPVYLSLLQQGKTDFTGYGSLRVEDARVLAVLKDDARGGVALAPRLERGAEGQIVLDRTPFYGESGGQVGDRGVIAAEGSLAEVLDCQVPLPGLYVHQVRVASGGFERGMSVRAEVDAERRAAAMRHHTGTHLLHAALRELLGPHVKQAGSVVAPERLRFDFSHYAPVGPRELRHLENRVNAEILKDSALQTLQMGREEALAYGALAFFGDKYGERVRVVEVPGFSVEFCGGTHVPRTGEIGLFLITDEQGISAGTRRVVALTGQAAVERAQQDQGILEELEEAAKVDRRSLVDEYAKLREQLKAKERELQALRLKQASSGATGIGSETQEVGGVLVWTPRFQDLDRKAHAAVVDDFRNRHKGQEYVVVSAASKGEDVNVVSAVSDSLTDRVNAPEILRRFELRGGGRPDFAQGGAVKSPELDNVLRDAVRIVSEMLERVRG